MDVRAAVAVAAGKLLAIAHTLPLARITEGFDLMQRGESIRNVVVY